MSESNSVTATMAVEPGAHAASGADALTEVSGPLMLLTWLAFLVLSVLLYKVAWKPILKGLAQREDSIRKALDEADKARAGLAESREESRRLVQEAEQRRAAILEEARTLAARAAAEAEQQAREQTKAATEAARAEIRAATEAARAALRQEAAELVTTLAGRLVGEKLDAGGDGDLVRGWVERLPPDLAGGKH